MHDMLAAFHLVRYFELRRKEAENYKDISPERQFSVGMRLFRKMKEMGRYRH